ncbi:MAG TPA: FGGY-family carbohydrate kinase, partial [Planctomycetota bacterium]|nr:FGGY-family carbohydrate kinase [Planctomycetota bacterium]
TNASRTLLYDIDRRAWAPDLCEALGVPAEILPRVVGSAERYGETAPGLFGRAIPLAGIAGDQQAALFGQGCFEPGTSKNTYGTGCFALVNCGPERPPDPKGLVTTLACDGNGRPVYALEGSVFIAGAVVQWLRDGLGLIATAAETEAIARSVPDTAGAYFVPAFVGLGAPYWDMDARGAITGLTRGTRRAHLVRAALESIAYQTRDLVEALEASAGRPIPELRVDGGATANDLLLEFQADILGKPLLRPPNTESTALGAAFLAGLAVGFWESAAQVSELLKGGHRRFEPRMPADRREALYAGWKAAVKRVLTR